jgi:hypothetical protein
MIHAETRRRGEYVRAEAQRRREVVFAAQPPCNLEAYPRDATGYVRAASGGVDLCASAPVRELFRQAIQSPSWLRVSASPREHFNGQRR